MSESIKLFNALQIEDNSKQNQPSHTILMATLPRGFVFSPEVLANYTDKQLLEIVDSIGMSAQEMNSSFHKSWEKVKTASMEQLVLEQVAHYITTYGFKSLGIYDEDTIYIPNERLEIPQWAEDFSLVVIKGYTKEELKEKVMSLLSTGIALKEETMIDLINLLHQVGLAASDIDSVKNKEVLVRLCNEFGLVPTHPVEFLRYVVHELTDSSLLIKSHGSIAKLAEGAPGNKSLPRLFRQFQRAGGSLENLSTIFYRFKPLFLALRKNDEVKPIVNTIRRLAKTNHRPMKEDYLNTVTEKVSHSEIDNNELREALSGKPIYRKIRLANALKYRTQPQDSIMYRVRNGKSYADEFSFTNFKGAEKSLSTVLDSISEDLNYLEGKNVYLPEGIEYTLPATEKQFSDKFPLGTCVTVSNDMIFGVYWKDVRGHTIDLDLSLLSIDGKIGWDRSYRNDERTILFSGDVTAAPRGASELFYIARQAPGTYLMVVNYFNYDENIPVPFNIIVGQEKTGNLKKNYMIDPSNVKAVTNSVIDQRQKLLGLVEVTEDECKFYFAESDMGNGISSRSNVDYIVRAREFLAATYRNNITLTDILERANVNFVTDEEECEINLSPQLLEKDTIISLITNSETQEVPINKP